MKICIFGAGAIGGYMGAKLAQAGADVSLVARGPHLKAMRENGLRLIEDTGESFPGSEGPRRPIDKWFKPDQLGEGWTKVRLSHLFTPTGDQARLTFFHRGDGTVQVRNLQVSIDGESVPAPERKAKTTDGPDDQPPSHFDRFEAQGLQMPHLQQMDYSLARLPDPRKGGREGLLELRCAARVDRARRALDWLDRLVSQASTTSAGARDSAWPSQLARLIRQSIDWRTLYEPNRDVYLAENVLWLHRTRFPGQRLLVFGHSSHTENQDQRMGKILLEELGDDYRTVTLRTLGGAFRYFGPVGEAGPDPPLEKVTLDPARSSALSRGLAELVGDGFATGGLAANLTAMASTEDGRAWLQELAPDAVRPDIQLVIPAVDPIVLAEETRPDGDEPPAYVRPPGL